MVAVCAGVGVGRKADVRATPSSGEANSTIALLVALALAGLVGAVRRRWDLAAAALIGLGLCAAIGIEAASNPSATLLAETLGYTMWWGSELGLWVWLILAWALWLGLVGLSRPRAALRRRVRVDRRAPPSWTGPAAAVLASLAGLAGVAAVGSAVAERAKPDSHVYGTTDPRRRRGIERLIDRAGRSNIASERSIGTQPMEPAIRFLLAATATESWRTARSRDWAPTTSSLPSREWTDHLLDGTRPQPHMTLAARVRFTDPWGRRSSARGWARRNRGAVAATHSNV